MDRLRRPSVAQPSRGRRRDEEPELELRQVETPVSVRQLAAREAERLRAAAAAPEYERRELLSDLGTRLEALVRDLGGSPDAAAVRHLAADLAEDHLAGLSGDALTELWERALQLLDHLAGEQPAPGGAFWKRS